MALGIKTVMDGTQDRILHVKTVSFDSSYPTGGEALTAANLGFSDLAANLLVFALPKAGYTFAYDGANAKLIAYQGDNDNAGDAPGIEVADTTSLATVTDVIVFAFGRSPA